jgi:hypothetical protein
LWITDILGDPELKDPLALLFNQTRELERIPDPFSPSVKSLRFLKSAACTISTNVTPPERETLLMSEQTCADLRPRLCDATRDFKTSA